MVTIKELSCVLSILPVLVDLKLTTLWERFLPFVNRKTHAYRGSQGSACLPKAIYDQMSMREIKSKRRGRDLGWLGFYPVEAKFPELNSQTESTK